MPMVMQLNEVIFKDEENDPSSKHVSLKAWSDLLYSQNGRIYYIEHPQQPQQYIAFLFAYTRNDLPTHDLRAVLGETVRSSETW